MDTNPIPSPEQPIAEDQQFFESLERFLFGTGTLAEVVGLSEDDLEMMVTLGDQQLESGRLQDAQVIYEGCVVLDPYDPSTLCRLATVLHLGGDHAAAEHCFAIAEDLSEDARPIATYRRSLVTPAA